MKKLLLVLILLCGINLQAQKRSSSSDKSEGIALLLGGTSFTFAAVIEGGSQYGTYKPSQNGKNTNSVLFNPPFIAQTPRNIMFGIGLTLTITGLISLK